MKLSFLTSVTVLFLLLTPAAAMTLEGRCEIKFFGRSTLHDFQGKVDCQPFSLASTARTDGVEIIQRPTIKVLVREMSTGNSARDKKMLAMFEQGTYPEIHGLFNDLDPEQMLQHLKAETGNPATLEFELLIRQQTRRIQAPVRDLNVTQERISFVVDFPLALSDFRLEPPSFLGMIRVDDQVRVEVHVVLLRQP